MKQYRLFKIKRIIMIYIIVLIGFIFLFIRLSYVKIVKGQDYYNLALDLWTRTAPTKGVRGNIYDRNGNLLAYNELAYTVAIEDVYESSKTKNADNRIWFVVSEEAIELYQNSETNYLITQNATFKLIDGKLLIDEF